MKAIKSLSKIIICFILALSLVTLTACDVLGDFFGKGNEGSGGGEGGNGDGSTTYTVTLNTDGGNVDNLTSYTAGTVTPLPTPTKDYYEFAGWYENADKSGTAVTQISSTATGNKTFYAKWTPETYNITYTIKGDSSYQGNPKTYTYNTTAPLPAPTKSGSNFNGWYANENCSGSRISQIAAGEHGDKHFYGEWKSGSTPVTTYSVTLHTDGGTLASSLTQYTVGVGADLPGITRDGYTFDGWYDNVDMSGTAVTKISSTATGNKEYWAKWTKNPADTLTITAGGGYEEGAYVEFDTVSGASSYKVSYKKSGASAYTEIDEELIRVDSSKGTVRADIVGIAKGSYNVKVEAGSKSATKDITVTAEYDRSGYAHFDSSRSDKTVSAGVGAYNNDGTPKNNAVIVYVTEATKNTVSAKIGSKTYSGLSKILNGATSSSTPVIVRIIGRISAPTWAHDGDNPMIKYTKADSKLIFKEAKDQTYTKFGITLENKSYTQSELTGMGFKLEKGITALDGLTSTMKPASDCCWNNMSIGSSSKKPTNITLEGIGTDAEIFQWGFTWNYANSVEIRNITFDDYTEDACSFQGNTGAGTTVSNFNSSRIWVHNCTFNEGKNYWDTSDDQDKGEGDGATDFKAVSNVTVSYNRYFKNHKTGLVGANSTSYTANVTFGHNFYDQCSSRLPMGRQANIHMYNNYYRKTSSYCLSARNNMYAFVEACYFENCNNTVTTDGTGARVKLYASEFVGCSYDTKNTEIKKVDNRSTVVDNSNFMNPDKQTSGYCLDNDPTMFYLNGDGTTKAYLTTASAAKWECVNNAGVHKPSGWVKISTDTALNKAFPLIKG